MKEEFNLSERLMWITGPDRAGDSFILIEDVKEFIKRLKDFCNLPKEMEDVGFDFMISRNEVKKEIDKLAGDKLI